MRASKTWKGGVLCKLEDLFDVFPSKPDTHADLKIQNVALVLLLGLLLQPSGSLQGPTALPHGAPVLQTPQPREPTGTETAETADTA